MDVLSRFLLTDRVALITGGSSGLGAHAAVGLASAGADIVIVARRADRLEQVRSDVEDLGRKCLVVPGDITDPDTGTQAVRASLDAFGKLDILLNNAGLGTSVPAVRETHDEFTRVIDVNLTGAYWMAQACGRAMKPGSSIVNVSSVLALTTGGQPQAAYSASKAGLLGLTRDLAQQWTERKGIRVNAVAPGFFASEMTDTYKPEYLEAMIQQRILAARMGHPHEFVSAVLFLASAASSYVTGAVLAVDGGLLIT